MSNEKVILLNNLKTSQPLVTRTKGSSVAKGRLDNHCLDVCRYINLIPVYCQNNPDDILMYIPTLKDYKPSHGLKSFQQAVYENPAPMENEDNKQLEYLKMYTNIHSLVYTNAKEITITGLSNLTHPQLYFVVKFLNSLGFAEFETNIVTIHI